MLARIADKIPDNQEIIDKAHGVDDVQFIGKPLPGGFRLIRIAGFKTFLAQPAEQLRIAFAGIPVRDVMRQMMGGEIKIHPAAHGYDMGTRDCLAQVGEQRTHLLLAFEVHFFCFHAHALAVLQRLARLDAHEHLLRARVFTPKVMAVIGHNQRDAGVLRQRDQLWHHLFLLHDGVIHQLNEIIIPAHDAQHQQCMGPGVLISSFQQQLGQFPRQAGGGRNQPVRVGFKHLKINPGLIVEALSEACAGELHQISVALHIFAQQNQVAVFAVGAAFFMHVLG